MKDENKRDLCLKVRVSQAEIDAIKKKFENSGMSSLSGFVRAMIFEGYIVHMDENELHKIYKLATNIANNINQIAVRVNSTENIYNNDIAANGHGRIWNPPLRLQGGASPTPRIRRNAYNKENAPMSQMTKRALVASLKDLLAEKPLDKITVTDLTEHCGVNRMTFYYHFKDIYDLVEWACIESATRALAGQKTYDTWQQGFLQILQAVQKDKVFVTKVYHSISREHIENYLYRLTYDLMIGVVEEKAAGMTVRPEDKEFIANFYKYAFVGLTLEWVRTGMKDDPAALIERVSTLIHGDITKGLEACRIDK